MTPSENSLRKARELVSEYCQDSTHGSDRETPKNHCYKCIATALSEKDAEIGRLQSYLRQSDDEHHLNKVASLTAEVEILKQRLSKYESV